MKEQVSETGQCRTGLVLDHIGYAVESIDKALREFYLACFGPCRVSETYEDPGQKVRVAFVDIPGGRLELIEPVGADSPVARLLSSKRGGLYHLGFAASRFDEAIETFMRQGCRIISGPSPAVAFQGRKIVFLITPSFDIIEILEGSAEKGVWPGQSSSQQVQVDQVPQLDGR